MTNFLIDLASYQDGINLQVVKNAGFNKVNVKLSQGNWYKWGNAGTYINQAKNLGFGISTFHWLDSTDSGGNQAKIVQGLMKQYGVVNNSVHQCDCEETKKPATWTIWRDYVDSMQQFLGRHIINYTGDWWWKARGWNGASLTPYLWAPPNSGYLGSYPGDSSGAWSAGYGGWNELAFMQYNVSGIANAGGGSLSKTAIRDINIWSTLAGHSSQGADMGSLVMAHEKGSNVDWVGNGIFRFKCPDAGYRANLLAMIGYQGGNATSLELYPGSLDVLGPIVIENPFTDRPSVAMLGLPVTIPQAQTQTVNIDEAKLATDIATVLISSNTNGLTTADHDAVVADIKRALREGVGG